MGARTFDVAGERFRAAVEATPVGIRDVACRVGALDGEAPSMPFVPDVVLPIPFGEYVALRPVGRGSFGIVFEGLDLSSRERVAIKVLHELEPSALESFKNEARMLVDSSHPSLVAPDEIVEVEGRLALVMPFVDGTHFYTAFSAAARARGGLRDEPRCRRLVARLFHAVQALHALGRLHMDLKPGNVLVTPDEAVVLVDFGVSRARRSVFEHRLPGMAGTPFYLAPEQILGEALGTSADVYAAGVMLYEALTGVGPFDGVDVDEVFARVHAAPVPLVERRPGLPGIWHALVDGMLTREASSRPRLEALLELLGESGHEAGPVAADAFVGRDAEMAALDAQWARVVDGEGALAVISAEPGAGKTELAIRFATRVRMEADATVVVGRCYERESIPYAAVDAVIDRLCGLVRADAGLRAEVRALPGFDALCRVFPVFGTVRAASAEPPGSVASDDRSRGEEALQRVVELLSVQRPLLLVIDDAHWGDADSVDILGTLLARVGTNRVFVVLTVREADWPQSALGRALESRLRKGVPHAVQRLNLGALPPEAVSELVARRLGLEPDAAEVRRVVDAAGGNMFLVDQFVRDPDGVSGGGVHDLVRRRLLRWPADIQRLVRYAAVAAAPVEISALVQAADVPFPDRKTLARLRGAGLLRGAVGPMRRALTCYHDLVREAVVAPLDARVLAHTHRDLADALIAHHADAGTIARHRLAGGDAFGAATWALRGATEAEDTSAFTRAADLLTLVLDAGGEALPDRRAVRERHAAALVEAGRGQEAAQAFLSLAADAASPEASRAARRRAAEALLLVGEIGPGLAVLQPVLDALGLSGPSVGAPGVLRTVLGALVVLTRGTGLSKRFDPLEDERAETCWVGAKGLVFVEPIQGLDFVIRAARHGRRSGNPIQLARPLGVLAGFVLAPMPVLGRVADRWLAWVRDAGEARGEPFLTATHALWASLVRLQRGDLQGGFDHGRRAEDLFATVAGGAWERTQASSFVLRTLSTRGEYAAATAMGSALVRDAERRSDLYGQVLFGDYSLMAAIAAGAVDAARARAEWVRTTWLPDRYTVQSFYVMLHKAYADLLEGDAMSAARRLVEDRARFTGAGGNRIAASRVDHALLEGRIGLLVGASYPGLLPVPTIVKRLQSEGSSGQAGQAMLLQAGWEADRDPAAASARYAEAARVLEDAGLRMEAAAARLRAAERAGDTAGRDVARATMRRLGAADPDRWAAIVAPTLTRVA